MANLEALKAELAAGHPTTGAYSANDQTAADEINAENRTADRSNVPSAEILAAVTPTHYLEVFADAGNSVHRRYWVDIMASETVDLDNANIRAALTTIFAGKTSTLTALSALETVSISRATELNIGRVAAGTVAQARAL